MRNNLKKLLGGFGFWLYWAVILFIIVFVSWAVPYAQLLLPEHPLLARISVALFGSIIVGTIVGNLVVFLDRRRKKAKVVAD